MFVPYFLILLFASKSSADDIDTNDILDYAQDFIKNSMNNEGIGAILEGLSSGGMTGGKGGLAAQLQMLASMAPLLLNQAHEHHDDPELEDTSSHNDFESATNILLPVLGTLWEGVKNIDMIKNLMQNSGLQSTIETFTSVEGRPMVEKIVRSFENPMLRKRWLKSIINMLTNAIKQFAQADNEKMYKMEISMYMNRFLKSNGYTEMFHPGIPLEESIIQVLDLVARKEFKTEVDSAYYIRPAAKYIKDLIFMGKGSVHMLASREVEDKLADTVNSELIEGLLRVWRAYRHASVEHKCDKYLLCELNRKELHHKFVVRPIITKVSSIASAWFLSGTTGTPFMTLYDAVIGDYDCKKTYPANCDAFHEEDIKMTTEYAHNEL